MQGAISTIEAVERWFRANDAPFFTLAYYSSSSATGQGQVILRNTKDAEINTAWEKLKTAIVDQSGYGRAQLNLIVYNKPEAYNTPAGRTNIDYTAMQQVQGLAAIGSLPHLAPGYVSESDVAKMIEQERERWELRQELDTLREQINNPANDPVERIVNGFERIGSNPLGLALISKLLGGPVTLPAPVPIAGVHSTEQESDQDEEIDTDLDELEEIAKANGMTLKQFLQKTATLARQQPAVVSMLAQQ